MVWRFWQFLGVFSFLFLFLFSTLLVAVLVVTKYRTLPTVRWVLYHWATGLAPLITCLLNSTITNLWCFNINIRSKCPQIIFLQECLTYSGLFALSYKLWIDLVTLHKNSLWDFYWNSIGTMGKFREIWYLWNIKTIFEYDIFSSFM